MIADDTENAALWNLKGIVYEDLKEADQAINCYDKALSINPEYGVALENMGRMYFNLAVQKNSEISSITNNVKYQEALKNEVLPLFQKALPYYEKAYKLDPNDKNIKYALYNIFYNLNDKRMEDFVQ